MIPVRLLLRSIGSLLLLCAWIGCASVPHSGSLHHESAARSTDASNTRAILHPGSEAEPAPRGGLATAFGERLASEIDFTGFERGARAKPYAVGTLYYNDEEGAEAMARHLGNPSPVRGKLVSTAKGVADWGLKTRSGFLDGFQVGEKVILAGREGERYAIVLKNNTRQPLEFVVSVDGLDVIDGEPASYAKRGYIVGPKRRLEIEGFRTSHREVAAFRFGPVSDSYAVLRHDDPRNVGVIGVAVFSENGGNPWSRRGSEARRRAAADPFPERRFATPPP